MVRSCWLALEAGNLDQDLIGKRGDPYIPKGLGSTFENGARPRFVEVAGREGEYKQVTEASLVLGASSGS